MRKLLIKLLLHLLSFEYPEEGKKLSETEKTVMYHQVYEVPNYVETTRAKLRRHIQNAALKEGTMDTIWFERGVIFALQSELKTMRLHQDRWLKAKAGEEKKSAGDKPVDN